MRDLSECRAEIDGIDAQISELFLRRLSVACDIAAYKSAHGMDVLDRSREHEVVQRAMARVPADMAGYAATIQETLMTASRDVQRQMLAEDMGYEVAPDDEEDKA